MNTDIRISVDFFAHYKTMRVTRKLGGDGVVALIKLFCYAGKFRSGGILKGMGAEDIADAVGWRGEAEEFVGSLCDIGFLELCEEGIYSIHDWEEHNPWAAGAAERSEAASKAGKASAAKRAKNATDVQRGVGDSSTDVQRGVGDQFNGNPTPSPSPSPSPKEVRTTLKDSCAEPQKDEVQAPQQTEPPLIVFPLSKKGEEQAFYQNDIDQWRESFPGVDLRIELLKCRQWNIDNPTKRKTRSGIRTHISSWLGKAQNGQQGVNATSGRNSKVNVRDKAALLKSKTAEFLNGQNYIDNGENNESIGSGGNLLLEHQIP